MTIEIKAILRKSLIPISFTELETGRTLTFEGEFQIEALGTEEIESYLPSEPMRIPIMGRGAKLFDSARGGYADGVVSFNGLLDSRLTSRVLSLVPGGWLPSALGIRGKIVMPDRNVLRYIKSGAKIDSGASDFIDFFRNIPVCLNPVLVALEGNARKTPTPGMVRHQLQEIRAKFKKALPGAHVIDANAEGVIGLISDVADSTRKLTSFLLDVGAKVSSPVSKVRRPSLLQYVMVAADRHCVPRNALPVLLVVSAITNPQNSNPAFKLLKLRSGYSHEEAYNALADIGAMELLARGNEMFPETPATLCTADVDLAKVWVGLQGAIYGDREPYTGLLFKGITQDELQVFLNC